MTIARTISVCTIISVSEPHARSAATAASQAVGRSGIVAARRMGHRHVGKIVLRVAFGCAKRGVVECAVQHGWGMVKSYSVEYKMST